ncbi:MULTISPECIES: hypothetical protein [unclassified Treponema]|uniref:hypothetical protein n=1 Tax=unclassified Treponema TaxID=2638727 RepID=UPI0020A35D14|nr:MULTISPECIES: hypothetical protein [unclassified Treponema]UTC67196.1 hypothetical protein E4O06_00540 [Treponema sp. OMZ 789]UTC69925.1 hypothetical protein E4O01_00535 [Treponema sp. OMZ 790]UTC72640.1 hypothetical protein E4O02_00535 [Treponema sp. OMZ 791]
MNNLLRKGFQPVSETEMVMVDGDGVASAVAGAIIGGAIGGFVASCRMVGRAFSGGSMENAGEEILTSMAEGAIGGAISGALIPSI